MYVFHLVIGFLLLFVVVSELFVLIVLAISHWEQARALLANPLNLLVLLAMFFFQLWLIERQNETILKLREQQKDEHD